MVAAHPTPFTGTAYRHQSPGFSPLSGAGARRAGGRYTPPGSFATLYLCLSQGCVLAELDRATARMGLSAETSLPRELWAYTVHLSRTLDLREGAVRQSLRVDLEQLLADDRQASQAFGEAAYTHSIQALVSPSRTGVGDVLVVFPEHVGADRVEPRWVETWETAQDLERARHD